MHYVSSEPAAEAASHGASFSAEAAEAASHGVSFSAEAAEAALHDDDDVSSEPAAEHKQRIRQRKQLPEMRNRRL